jgi:hypothetical protein
MRCSHMVCHQCNDSESALAIDWLRGDIEVYRRVLARIPTDSCPCSPHECNGECWVAEVVTLLGEGP